MVTGTGSFILSQRDASGGGGMPAPPFAANSANNGLSVNGAGEIVLGDDIGGVLAALLSDREIDNNGFLFRFLNAGNDLLLLDPANDTYIFGDISQTYFYNDALGFEIASGGNAAIGQNVGNYRFGDLSAALNNTELSIDDPNQLVQFIFGTDPYFVLDNGTQNWAIGDYNNFVKPVVGLFSQLNLDGIYLEAHNTNDGRFNIDTGGASNHPLIETEIVRAGGIATGWTMDNDRYWLRHDNGYKMWFDWATSLYMIGDCDTFPTVGTGNGTHLNVDDAASTFFFKNTANNAGININGVGGFTGTVSPVNSITVDGGIVTAVS